MKKLTRKQLKNIKSMSRKQLKNIKGGTGRTTITVISANTSDGLNEKTSAD